MSGRPSSSTSSGRRTRGLLSGLRKSREAEKTISPAGLVLIAMGFLGPEEGPLKAFGVETDDKRGNAKAGYGSFATSAPGRLRRRRHERRGQSLVVWAIAEGRGAAREVDRFLMGETRLP